MKTKVDSFFNYSVKLNTYEKNICNQIVQLADIIFAKFLIEKLQINSRHISFGIVICGDYKIKRLNQEYRNKNKKTDVLSFALYPNFKDDADVFFSEIELGDIYICKNKLLSQAKENNVTFVVEFCHLLTHGFLHLLGFDHELSDEDEKIMFDLEMKLVKQIVQKIK